MRDAGDLLDTDLDVSRSRAAGTRRYGVAIQLTPPGVSSTIRPSSTPAQLYERDPDRCCIRQVAPLSRRCALMTLISGVSPSRIGHARHNPVGAVVRAATTLLKLNPLAFCSESARSGACVIFAHEVPYNPSPDQGYSAIGVCFARA